MATVEKFRQIRRQGTRWIAFYLTPLTDVFMHIGYVLNIAKRPVWLKAYARKAMRKAGLLKPTSLTIQLFIRDHKLAFSLILMAFFIVLDVFSNFTGGFTTYLKQALKDWESARLLIDYQMRVTIAFVGIVVPILILAVDAIGARTSSSFVSVLLQRLGPIRTINYSILTLLVEVLILSGFEVKDQLSLPWGQLIFWGTTFFFLNILLILILIKRVIQSFDDVWLYQALREEISILMERDITAEIENRIMRNMFDQICESYNFKLYLTMPRFLDGLTVPAANEGQIQDINLRAFEKLSRHLRGGMDAQYRAGICVVPSRYVTKDDMLAVLSPADQQSPDFSYLVKLLRRSFKIQRYTIFLRSQRQDLNGALTLLQDLAIRALEISSEAQFERMLSIYTGLLSSYMKLAHELNVKFPPHQLKQPFIEWSAIWLIQNDLRRLIERAAQHKDHHFVALLSHRLGDVLQEAIQYEDLLVFKNVVGLFPSMYYYSQRHGNTVGMDRATRSIVYVIDQYILHELQDASSLQRAEILRDFFRLALDSLMTTFKWVLENQDRVTFKQVSQHISELTVYYHPSQKLYSRQWQLQRQIEQLKQQGVSAEELEKESQLVSFLVDFPGWVNSLQRRIWFSAASYVVEGVRKNRLSMEFTKAVLPDLAARFSDPQELIQSYESQEQEDNNLTWAVWEEWEPTKMGQWIDTSGRSLWFYCLRGIALLKRGKEWPQAPSETIRQSVPRIESICQELWQERQQWSWFLPRLTKQDVKRFIEYNKALAQKAEEAEEDKIITSSLSDEKIRLFREAVLKAYAETIYVRPIFRKLNLERSEPVAQKGQPCLGFHELAPKSIFIDDPKYDSNSLGHEYGLALATAENQQLLKQLVRAGQKNKHSYSENPVTDLENLLSYMRKAGYLPEVIIMPVDIDEKLLQAVQSSSKFRMASRTERESWDRPHGFFDDVPLVLVELPTRLFKGILIANLSKTSILRQLGNLSVEVRLLDPKAVKALLRKNKKLSKREIDMCVVVRVQNCFKLQIIDNRGFILLRKGT